MLKSRRFLGSLPAFWLLEELGGEEELLPHSVKFTPKTATRNILENQNKDSDDLNAAREKQSSGNSALQRALSMSSGATRSFAKPWLKFCVH